MNLDKEKSYMELINKKNKEIKALKKLFEDTQVGKLTKLLNNQTEELNKVRNEHRGLLVKYNTIVDSKNKRAYKPYLGKKVEPIKHEIHKKPDGKLYQIVDGVPVFR